MSDMNKLTKTGMVAVAMIVAISCSNEKETPEGVKYTVVESGDGRVAKPGEVVVMEVSIRDKKDSAWFDSRKAGMPEMIMIRHDSVKKSEYGIIFRLTSAGDSITMTVPARDFFERTWIQPVPPGIDPLSPFTFYVKTTHVLDSMTAIKMRDSLEQGARAKWEREQAAQSSNQLAVDTTMIDEHLAGKNVKAQTTASGLRYIITKQGNGPKAVDGQVASVKYKGYLLSGTTFDEGEYSFPIGQRQVIQGWDEIVTLMNVGTKLTVYIPSGLAYGSQRRSQEILENTVLVFDMELKDLKNQ
jgi:FKBP-type peptidyl-prolyl cis-trans isomerase FkpA